MLGWPARSCCMYFGTYAQEAAIKCCHFCTWQGRIVWWLCPANKYSDTLTEIISLASLPVYIVLCCLSLPGILPRLIHLTISISVVSSSVCIFLPGMASIYFLFTWKIFHRELTKLYMALSRVMRQGSRAWPTSELLGAFPRTFASLEEPRNTKCKRWLDRSPRPAVRYSRIREHVWEIKAKKIGKASVWSLECSAQCILTFVFLGDIWILLQYSLMKLLWLLSLA